MISATILLRLRIAVFLFAAFTAGCLDDEARGLAWAPDGHALAWVEGGSVVVHDFVTSTRTVAEVSPPADELAWLPDGLIAVVKGDDDSWDLARLSADADVAPFLTGPARVAAPLVSRDGSRAVCVEFTDDGGRILQLVDAAPEPLNDLHGDQRPLSLSDDGRYLIWVRHDAGPPGHAQRDLWVHDFRLSLDWRLTEDVAVETLARWLPRSNAVLYAAQTGASASIHVVDIVDPKPKRLWRGEGVITDLEWTPDGHQVLFCNAGTLHRMTDRGRDVRTLDTFPFSMHDVALSPDGAVIAVSGAGGPVLLDSDWTNPRLLDGTRDEQLDLRIALAAAQEGKAMRESFNSLVGSTRNPQERMRILKRFGEELALDGDHDEAIRQFTRGLSVADPPDPEFHRLIAEEFMLAWGDFDRARIALENHHSERIDRTPSSERPPTESFALRVLRTREPAAMKPYAEMQRARRDGDWTDAADAFGALLLSAPEFADDLRSEGFAMLGEAQSGLPRSAEGIIDLAEVLPPLVENVEDRVALEKALVNAQLVQGHWSVAAEAMGVAARRRAPDAFDTFQAEAAEALLAHTLCQAQGIALYGEHPGDAVARVWGSEAIDEALAAVGTPAQRLLRHALLFFAAHVEHDSDAMVSPHNAVMAAAPHFTDPDQPRLGIQLAVAVETAWAYHLLREERWAEARTAFIAARHALAWFLDQAPEEFARAESESARLLVDVLEHAAVLTALEDEENDLDPLRRDAELLLITMAQPPLPVALPFAGLPRRARPSMSEGAASSARELARDYSRAAARADSPFLRDHLLLCQARAETAAGDLIAALALLRALDTGATDDAIARAALWEMAVTHRALGDDFLASRALDAWRTRAPSDLEWKLWEAVHEDAQ